MKHAHGNRYIGVEMITAVFFYLFISFPLTDIRFEYPTIYLYHVPDKKATVITKKLLPLHGIAVIVIVPIIAAPHGLGLTEITESYLGKIIRRPHRNLFPIRGTAFIINFGKLIAIGEYVIPDTLNAPGNSDTCKITAFTECIITDTFYAVFFRAIRNFCGDLRLFY